jgi:hypothetical protein
MGMSFGLIQWNFGMNTLGPVLKKMHDADPQAFEAAFAPGTNYQAIWSAIISGDFAAQKIGRLRNKIAIGIIGRKHSRPSDRMKNFKRFKLKRQQNIIKIF